MYFSVDAVLVIVLLQSTKNEADSKWLTRAVSRPSVLINATYQAIDQGIDISRLPQCGAWKAWWQIQRGDANVTESIIDVVATRVQTATITHRNQLLKYSLPLNLIQRFKVIRLNFEQICRNSSRIFWISSPLQALTNKINAVLLCELWNQLDEENMPFTNNTEVQQNEKIAAINENRNDYSRFEIPTKSIIAYSRDSAKDDQLSVPSIHHMDTPNHKKISTSEFTSNYLIEHDEESKEPYLLLRTFDEAERLSLNVDPMLFVLHQFVAIRIKRVCNTQLLDLDTEEYSILEIGSKERLNIGIDFETLEMDIGLLAKTLLNNTELDEIMTSLESEIVPSFEFLPSTELLQTLNRTNYDPRTPPVLFSGQKLVVKVGIHVQSMSNFQLTTMVNVQ
ncbi:hypothetical protein AB6A40_007253 [Gnathostoma spinigerum]|uniref:Uncharacterized protein n=1 Tax=Gnathostoma spinigerum TaxID=75299 RepID=A0ABD6EQU1_9BILA